MKQQALADLHKFYISERKKTISEYKKLGITFNDPPSVFNPLIMALTSLQNLYFTEQQQINYNSEIV